MTETVLFMARSVFSGAKVLQLQKYIKGKEVKRRSLALKEYCRIGFRLYVMLCFLGRYDVAY